MRLCLHGEISAMKPDEVKPTIAIIDEAVNEHRNGKPEKLVQLFLEGYNLRMFESSRERILELLKVSKTGKGRPKVSIETCQKHSNMMSDIAYLHGANIPLYNETNPNALTACYIVANRCGKNPKSLYASYVKERNKPELKAKYDYGEKNNLFIREYFRIS
ncbi:MAG: hypothetical protein ABF331_06125 [Hellea sp.]